MYWFFHVTHINIIFDDTKDLNKNVISSSITQELTLKTLL